MANFQQYIDVIRTGITEHPHYSIRRLRTEFVILRKLNQFFIDTTFVHDRNAQSFADAIRHIAAYGAQQPLPILYLCNADELLTNYESPVLVFNLTDDLIITELSLTQ